MGKALYRKYRSKSLEEIVGQEHITTTLSNALKQGKIAHAYLLTGPKGVGKTSIARILAHEVNGLPYSEDPNLDIIEIDAASNNGVEDVRDLRDKLPSAPVSARYKVFIIDEVHMLSKSAFNALLKTLEEPPAHVIFILATTEAHKLPDTIISRTQRFSFRPVPEDKVVEHLKMIAEKEHITIDDESLRLIAVHGEGSFRDSISLLDQASSTKEHIQKTDIEQLLGRAPSTLIDDVLEHIDSKDMIGCLQDLQLLSDQGYEAGMIAMQLGHALRQQLIAANRSINMSAPNILAIARDLLDVPGAHNPQALLEIVVLKHASAEQPTTPQSYAGEISSPITSTMAAATAATSQEETVTKRPATEAEASAAAAHTATATAPAKDDPVERADTAATASSDDTSVMELWQEALQSIKKSHNTLYGIARMARPTLEGDVLTLEFTFAFHQKRLNEPRNKDVLTTVMEQVRHKPTQVVCILGLKQTAGGVQTSSVDVHTISNIFGGAELLES